MKCNTHSALSQLEENTKKDGATQTNVLSDDKIHFNPKNLK